MNASQSLNEFHEPQTWMRVPDISAPYIAVFRGEFSAKQAGTQSILYSADERCQLFLDGKRISEGPERGIPQHWYYQIADLDLSEGPHVLCARVFAYGEKLSAVGQMSAGYGFFIQGLNATWSYQLEEVEFVKSFPDWGAAPKVCVGATRNPAILAGRGGIWQPVEYYQDSRVLYPPFLPPMRYEPIAPQKLRPGVFRFDEYVCAYADYHFSGRGKVKIGWCECPYYSDVAYETLKGDKRDRNGTHFYMAFDEFEVDGTFSWPLPYFRAGRYVVVEADPGVQVSIDYFRTGYPLPPFEHPDPLLQAAWNTLQNCCFETFMDCPYYEQLMYIADARVDALCLYHSGDDHRLAQKSLLFFALGQEPDGSLRSQFPSIRVQKINSFMMIWLFMLHDYFKVHGRDALVGQLLPVADRLLGYFRSCMEDGLLFPRENWNFIDWCKGWDFGSPIGEGPNSVLNFLYVMALKAHSETTGDCSLAETAAGLLQKIRREFYDPEKHLYYDFKGNPAFSEHAQVLALLCDVPEADELIKSLADHSDLIPCSIYFSFYYLTACKKYGLRDLFQKRMGKFRKLLEENLTTLPEEFENPRSDCHAWSSYILLFAEDFSGFTEGD